MVDKLRSLARIVANEISKHSFLKNAKFSNVQNIVGAKYETIAKQINNEIIMFQDPKASGLQPGTQVPRKLVRWWRWYQQLTGLDTVEVSREQVVMAQEKLFGCQEKWRLLNRQATMLNEKLKETYAELIQTKRDDPKYVQLTVIENRSLQDHAKVMTQLSLLEKEERDYFTQLATAIKEYHDSQAMNTQRYKYLSMLASAVLAIMSLVGSMVYNNKRIVDVRNVIASAQERNEMILTSGLQSLQGSFDSKLADIIQKLETVSSGPQVVEPVQEPEISPELIQLVAEPTEEYFQHNASQRPEIIKSCIVIALSLVGVCLTKALYG